MKEQREQDLNNIIYIANTSTCLPGKSALLINKTTSEPSLCVYVNNWCDQKPWGLLNNHDITKSKAQRDHIVGTAPVQITSPICFQSHKSTFLSLHLHLAFRVGSSWLIYHSKSRTNTPLPSLLPAGFDSFPGQQIRDGWRVCRNPVRLSVDGLRLCDSGDNGSALRTGVIFIN